MASDADYLGQEAHQALAEAARRAGRGPVRRLIRKALPASKTQYEGIIFNIEPARNYTDFHFWMHGHPKEHRSLALIADLVRERRVCLLDVGANMGLYSLWVAHWASQESEILAFEPNPIMANRLRANIELNPGAKGRVKVFEKAIGSAAGDATLYVPLSNAGEASIRGLDTDETEVVSVQVAPLIEYLPQANAKWEKVVLKVDIEGYEDAALSSLMTCEEDRLPDAILLEVTHQVRWQSDIVASLVDRGYRKTHELEGNLLLQRG